MSKNFERVDIQMPVTEAINRKIKDLGVEPTPDHQRRTIRAVLHTAGKMMLEAGGGVSAFRQLAEECFGKEKVSTEHVGGGQESDVKVEFTSGPEVRSDKRILGGYVLIAQRNVKTNLPIFSYVDEVGHLRTVRPGNPLDIALRAALGTACIGGGNVITVAAAKSADEFTIEYTTGYKSAS